MSPLQGDYYTGGVGPARGARDELKDIVEHFKLQADARSPASMLEAVASSKKAKLPPILGDYLRDRLEELCEALGLASAGTKPALVERLTGKTTPAAEPPARAEPRAPIQPLG